VLPVIPGILTVVTGTNIAAERPDWRPVLRDTSLFVAGFSLVFVTLGAGASSVGSAMFRNQALLARITGAVILIMGVYLIGSLVANSPWLYQEKRFHPRLDRFGPFAAPLTGIAFGFGWTPCIGPILTSILALAATRGSAGEGAVLLAIYAAGLGIPFVATALAYTRLTPVFRWFKTHLRGATLLTGTTLSAFGALLVTGQLAWITTQLQNLLRAVGLEELIFLG
jgi:cytochrome c-type biogenesis protein